MGGYVWKKDALRLIIEETIVKSRLVYQKKKTLSLKNNTSALFPAR